MYYDCRSDEKWAWEKALVFFWFGFGAVSLANAQCKKTNDVKKATGNEHRFS